MARFAFSLVFFIHIVTVYPRQLKSLILGADVGLIASRDRSRPLRFFYLFSTAVLGAGFLARIWRLTWFLNVDEPKWLIYRIPDFFGNLLAFNWQNLLISDKPGVTLAWLAEAGLVFTDKEGNGLHLTDPELLLASRLPLVIFNILLLYWLTSLVRRATKSEGTALLFLVLTATSPTVMGMARIVNPDSVSWFFPLATALAFFLYLKENRPWDLIACAFIFSVGVLNKFNVLIILPFLPILAILYYLFSEPKPTRFFKATAVAATRIYLLGGLFAIAIWPYLLLAPWQYLNQTLLRPVIRPLSLPIIVALLVFWFFDDRIGRFLQRFSRPLKASILIVSSTVSLALIAATIRSTPLLPSVGKGTKVLAPFAKLIINNYYYHFYSQTTLTVILYLVALVALAVATFRPEKFGNALPLSAAAAIFVLFYLGGSAATSHLTSPRYQMPVFPAVSLLIAATLMPLIAKAFGTQMVRVGIALSAVISFALVLPFAPHYMFYHNHFLPPGKLVFEGGGVGGYEAAQYLNKKPNAKGMRAFASYNGFGGFFVGEVVPRDGDPFNPPVDYLVVFLQGAKKTVIGNDRRTDEFWRQTAKPEWEMVVNQVPIIKVIKYSRPR